MPRKFDTIQSLMRADERGELDDSTFDDELWFCLIEVISGPEDKGRFDDPVLVYFASRYLEWEVGNGGFAQAAYNIPEWFALAAWGYKQLGLGKAAALIEEAIPLLAIENRETAFVATDIGELFEQFAESKLAALDQRVDESGWWAIDTRLKYVRSNRESFLRIA